MICTYCRAQNEEDDHRCHRCGRRVSGDAPAVIRGSAVPEVHREPAPQAPRRPVLEIVPPSVAPQRTERREPLIQGSLFGPVEIPRNGRAPRPQAARPAAPRPRRAKVEHPTLDFSAQSAHALKTSVEASIYCSAEAAPVPYRIMAAIIDTGIGLAGAGVFAATFHLAGYDFEWTRQTAWVLGAATLIITLLYRTLFSLGCGDTVGLRMTRLRLVNFDGRPANRRERFYRLAGGMVSSSAIAMGLLWALVEEEHLTWHDLMSKTFPTLR
jgi:uncharacterized RDD family membrane protein YckC